ncbi:MAG: TRAP transporter small permease subunit [Azospirillaceae bacterium]
MLRRLVKVCEAVSAALLVVMFSAFLLHIAMRYVFNDPLGWTVELQTICWLWLILWASALVLSEDEEIRFDIVYGSVSGRVRRVFRAVFSVVIVALYVVSLPAVYDYVDFMAVDESPYLDVPYNLLFSVYLIFAVASIVRYLWIGGSALMGLPDDRPDSNPAG